MDQEWVLATVQAGVVKVKVLIFETREVAVEAHADIYDMEWVEAIVETSCILVVKLVEEAREIAREVICDICLSEWAEAIVEARAILVIVLGVIAGIVTKISNRYISHREGIVARAYATPIFVVKLSTWAWKVAFHPYRDIFSLERKRASFQA